MTTPIQETYKKFITNTTDYRIELEAAWDVARVTRQGRVNCPIPGCKLNTNSCYDFATHLMLDHRKTMLGLVGISTFGWRAEEEMRLGRCLSLWVLSNKAEFQTYLSGLQQPPSPALVIPRENPPVEEKTTLGTIKASRGKLTRPSQVQLNLPALKPGAVHKFTQQEPTTPITEEVKENLLVLEEKEIRNPVSLKTYVDWESFGRLSDELRQIPEMKAWNGKWWKYYMNKHHGMVPCYACHAAEAKHIHHASQPFFEILLQALKETGLRSSYVERQKDQGNLGPWNALKKVLVRIHNKLKAEDCLPNCPICNFSSEKRRKTLQDKIMLIEADDECIVLIPPKDEKKGKKLEGKETKKASATTEEGNQY